MLTDSFSIATEVVVKGLAGTGSQQASYFNPLSAMPESSQRKCLCYQYLETSRSCGPLIPEGAIMSFPTGVRTFPRESQDLYG